jgi:signal transduction histidine kinase
MTTLKTAAKITAAAAVIFALNGLVNYFLMRPLAEQPQAINGLRYHLDDAVFVLLFIFAAIVFGGMFAVLPKERGYLYLAVLSLLTSLQLFSEWDDKKLLFGAFPEIPYSSLAIKSGTAFIAFLFIAYLLGAARERLSRGLILTSGVLWVMSLISTAAGADRPLFIVLNRLFIVLVLLNMAYYLVRFLFLIRDQKHRSELRWIAKGFILFMLILLPDIGKDLLEDLTGRTIGNRLVYWEQCLEDTFPWALLELVTVFGILFFRRFIQTLQDNKNVTSQLQSKNKTLQQEVETRQRLDQLLSVLTRAYRVSDLEDRVLREGQRYFLPYRFCLVKYQQAEGSVQIEGEGIAASQQHEILSYLKGDHSAREQVSVIPSMVLAAAGGTTEMRLFLAVTRHGIPIKLEDRDHFALQLMAKYVSIFYEYFQLIEARLNELEQRKSEHEPWLAKLFMQIAEKERKRLASDLHDEVLQELLNMRRLLERSSDEQLLKEEKEQIRRGLENAEFMIRETCSELMPSFLSDHGILHAISKLVDKTRLRADFQLEYQSEPITDSLSDEQTTTIYRIVQELINNALKHSDARKVTLEVAQQDGLLNIRYSDDGKGMETGKDFSQTNRFGLRGISERVRMVGGSVSMESQPGRGMKILCAIPL